MSLAAQNSPSADVIRHGIQDGKARLRPSKQITRDLSRLLKERPPIEPVENQYEDLLEMNGNRDFTNGNIYSQVERNGNPADGRERMPSSSILDSNRTVDSGGSKGGMNPEKYAVELDQHLKGKVSSSKITLLQILENLRDDLKRNRNFVAEFASNPVRGLLLLVRILEKIQLDRKTSGTQKTVKTNAYSKTKLEETTCLSCIEAILRHQEHLTEFHEDPRSTEVISHSSMTDDDDINGAAIQILSLVTSSADGHVIVLEALSQDNARLQEAGRLTGLVRFLDRTLDHHHKATVVRLFNDLWSSAPNMNSRIFLQQELQLAKFLPENIQLECQSSNSGGTESLRRELNIWIRNSADVARLPPVHYSPQTQRNAQVQRQELEQLRSLLKERDEQLRAAEETRRQAEGKCKSYREKTAELQDKVKKLRSLYKDRTGYDPEETMTTTDLSGPLGFYDTLARNFSKQAQLRHAAINIYGTISSCASNSIQSVRMRTTSNYSHLPQLNWTPLQVTRATIFEKMDIEKVLEEMDFAELETVFQLPSKQESSESNRRERSLSNISQKIHFVESNRAKNMIITQKKIGLNPMELKLAIDTCDVSALPGEYAQLLLKYIPTNEELQQIGAFEGNYEELDEAEKFLYQMSLVERLDTKLAVLVFMGVYDEIIPKLKPAIEMLKRASDSVIECKSLQDIFQIILVYGNYMNCTGRGCAPGFKLDTLTKLTEVKSHDKDITLLHYIVSIIEKDHPSLAKFYEHLALDGVKTVSYQLISENVQTLRKGLEIGSMEMTNQPNNEILTDFCIRVYEQVSVLGEPYDDMVDSYRTVCMLFGENYRLIEPPQLFGYLIDFVGAFKKASHENRERQNSSARATTVERKPSTAVTATTTNPPSTVQKAARQFNSSEVPTNSRRVESTQKLGHRVSDAEIVEQSSLTSQPSKKAEVKAVPAQNGTGNGVFVVHHKAGPKPQPSRQFGSRSTYYSAIKDIHSSPSSKPMKVE